MNEPTDTGHNDLIEQIAELLYERIQLGQPVLPVYDRDKKPWMEAFDQYLTYHLSPADMRQIETSSNYYALLNQLVNAWHYVDQRYPAAQTDKERLHRLDALFSLLEKKLLALEKQNRRQRFIIPTRRGLFILGTRPLLAYEAEHDERAPMDVSRLYRRFNLVTDAPATHKRAIIDGNQFPYASHLMSQSPVLNIGLAALSGSVSTHFEPTDFFGPTGSNARLGFVSSTMLPESAYEQELRDCIDWAIAEKVHILCLPELSVCPNGREVLKAHISQRASEEPLSDLSLIVAGSYHVGDHNEAPVWLLEQAGQITESMYRKRDAFETRLPTASTAPVGMKKLVDYAQANAVTDCYIREAIASDESILLLNLPIGLVGVIICKDFLNPEYYRHYNAFEPDYLLIVSMNVKSGEFIQTWRKYPKRHALTAGFYVNATQVVHPGDAETEVIFWGLPAPMGTDTYDSRIYSRRPESGQHTADKQTAYAPLPDHGRLRVSIPLPPSSLSTSPNLPQIGA